MMFRRSPRLLLVLAWGAMGCAATPPASVPEPTGETQAQQPQAPIARADTTPDLPPESKGEPAASPPEANPDADSAATEVPSKAPTDPYADMPHPPDTDSGRPQLSAADVKETIKVYRPHMREMCWIPRVNEHPKGPAKVRVAIEVQVAQGGTVDSIRAVGGKGYEGLAECVEQHVRRWHFPHAKQKSTLMFPILFQRGESTLIQVN